MDVTLAVGDDDYFYTMTNLLEKLKHAKRGQLNLWT